MQNKLQEQKPKVWNKDNIKYKSTKNIKIHMEHPILIRKKLLCYGHGNKKNPQKSKNELAYVGIS